jgi:hypothetical protein
MQLFAEAGIGLRDGGDVREILDEFFDHQAERAVIHAGIGGLFDFLQAVERGQDQLVQGFAEILGDGWADELRAVFDLRGFV